eukprot:11488_1
MFLASAAISLRVPKGLVDSSSIVITRSFGPWCTASTILALLKSVMYSNGISLRKDLKPATLSSNS